MQFFSYHIACREDSVASKEPKLLSPRAHTIRNANIINTVRRRDFSGARILYNCLILKATFKFFKNENILIHLVDTPYWTVLKTEKPRRVRRNSNIGHQCHEIASVYLCTPAMEKKTSELMHSKSTFLF